MFIKRAIFLMVLLSFSGSLCLAGWLVWYAADRAEGDTEETVTVVIPKGTGVQQISEILGHNGLIRDDIRFQILAKYLKLSAKLQAGEFALHRGQTPGEVLRELAAARPVQHVVTVPEGLSITQVAGIFASKGWADRDEFLRLSADREFLQSLGLASRKSLEGYLYPDTYYLTRNGQETSDIIRMQVRRFFTVWKDLEGDVPPAFSPYEILILASMVEKETGEGSERPLIAGVFLNRLEKKMRLQSDPTVIYGMENFSGNLTRNDLKAPSPYNTYTLKGLPAGPICSPGKDALAAVLYPEKSEYLYFVSKNDGTHYFSKNLREHNRAVNKYQRRGK